MATGTITKVMNDSNTGYCKMPDGTLICWGEENSGAIPANGAITVYTTFPEEYIAIPVVTCVARYASTVTARYFQAAVHTIGTTGVQLTAVNTYSNAVTAGTHFINWIAIGRWK